MSSRPRMLMADASGAIFEHPRLLMAGASGLHTVRPDPRTVHPIPPYTKLFFLPGYAPVGLEPQTGKPVTVETFRGRRVWAVSCFLPPGHLRLLLPAASRGEAPNLPLWAYSAVGWEGGMVAPFLTLETTPRWSPANYDDRVLRPAIARFRRDMGPNRLVDHLERCATQYHCFAAKNLFLGRWEAPLPVSRACNAACLGCLSWQPSDGCTPSHERLRFTPSVDEVVRVAVRHLEEADEPIVSFGQGCEGEPLTEAALIEESIRRMRVATDRGVINLNTNGFCPTLVGRLVEAGLDSIRISLGSARPEVFVAYHRPVGYSLHDVAKSIATAGRAGAYTMINYLVFPGVTDQPEEIEALVSLAKETGVRFIHLKNLSIDPWYYLRALGAQRWPPGCGMDRLVRRLREALPNVELGYFNRWSLPCPGATREGVGGMGGQR